MSSWDALFDYGLARTCFMCSPTAVEELGPDGFNEAPVGTGAFKVSKWVHADCLTHTHIGQRSFRDTVKA